ncbi:septation protein SepH [Longispora albida]|uniref:septation protein SepH n=1 Tax=Longispora albida TaxID=203523 RepID=UPI000382C8A3|nr:septation protein SepH [Longispora albida]
MRPVRFVALSEDGQALVLADEVGRLLALPIDEQMTSALRHDRTALRTHPASPAVSSQTALSPRDIQARIRGGESAEDVARVANVPVDRVLRYAGPVLQERAMLAQHARRTRLRTSDRGASLAEVVDARLGKHGVDAEKVSWDAYRRDDGTWRVVATWPSGKATAQAVWELDKARQVVIPSDDMSHYLCTERPAPLLGQDPLPEPHSKGHDPVGPAARPLRPADQLGEARKQAADPIRSGRDALLASLERPLDRPGRGLEPAARPSKSGTLSVSAFAEDDSDAPKEIPAVPSLAVLRPRRTTPATPAAGADSTADKPRKKLPSWDDVLFGSAPATPGQATS